MTLGAWNHNEVVSGSQRRPGASAGCDTLLTNRHDRARRFTRQGKACPEQRGGLIAELLDQLTLRLL